MINLIPFEITNLRGSTATLSLLGWRWSISSAEFEEVDVRDPVNSPMRVANTVLGHLLASHILSHGETLAGVNDILVVGPWISHWLVLVLVASSLSVESPDDIGIILSVVNTLGPGLSPVGWVILHKVALVDAHHVGVVRQEGHARDVSVVPLNS